MRKYLLLTIVLLLTLVCGTALAQSLSFESINASCEVDDTYIVLTADNLDRHTEWIAAHSLTQENIQTDFANRGVLAQLWTADDEICVEITAVQNDWATTYFDLDQQDTTARASYRKAFLNNNAFGSDTGYRVQEAEWKKTSQYGRVLMVKYKHTDGDDVRRGFMRAMVRNGYDIRVDLQVSGRNLKNTDLNAINTIMNTWQFAVAEDLPTTLAAAVEFTQLPPAETNTGKFTVSGTCDPGLRLVAVILRMSSSDPLVVETTATARGKFSFDNIKLSAEGIYLMTVTAMNGENEVGEFVFDPITYQESLLIVNFDDTTIDYSSELTQTIPGDTLVISGTTLGQVTIQCIVDGPSTYTKTITTNNSGKFSFKVDTTLEGDYSIVLAMDKKKANSRRFAITANRTVTKEDMIARAKTSAVKPGYGTLTEKITGYTGRILTYQLYITDIQQAGDEWILTTALRRTKAGLYSNFIIVTTNEEPNYSVDSLHTFYGTCTGTYTVENEENSTTYPCMELIYME